MRFATLRNCGQLAIEFNNDDSEGARVARDLLRELVRNSVKRCVAYYDKTGDHVFAHGERELNSVICPSVAAITPAFLTEYLLTRKLAGEDETLGRVDYWISYRKFSFLLELKHSEFAYKNSKTPGTDIFNKFNEACKQLKAIRKADSQIVAFTSGAKELIKIAFETIVFYRETEKENKKVSLRKKDIISLFSKIVKNKGLDKPANMRALWILKPELIELQAPLEYGSYDRVYHAVAFVGNISEGQIK